MTDTMEETEIELKVEDLDKYCEAAAAIVEELRDFLSGHYHDLTKPPMTHRIHGQGGEMPKASDDPQYAAKIHNYKNACDQFINIMRGNL
jgi:hypothetical protein